MRWTGNEIALSGAAATIVVAALAALAAYLAAKRERRRTLYAEAVQVIAAWNEMLYRVRRRVTNDAPELVSSFHEHQDKLTYFQAWIAADSKYMSRSYARLVREVKGATESLIQAAWEQPPRKVNDARQASEKDPDISGMLDDLARDCRSHLSPWPWRKVAMAWRNGKSRS